MDPYEISREAIEVYPQEKFHWSHRKAFENGAKFAINERMIIYPNHKRLIREKSSVEYPIVTSTLSNYVNARLREAFCKGANFVIESTLKSVPQVTKNDLDLRKIRTEAFLAGWDACWKNVYERGPFYEVMLQKYLKKFEGK